MQVDIFGRPFDDLDLIKMRAFMSGMVGDNSYIVYSASGVPMIGYVNKDSFHETISITATKWDTQ